MKLFALGGVVAVASYAVFGQGTFIYDQQSSTDEILPQYGSGVLLQATLPAGQTFTPSLTGIDFIRLKFNDADLLDGLGATIYLDLRANSLTGSVLGVTMPVTIGNAFRGVTNFFFPNTIALTPGDMYCFQVFVTGGPWNVDVASYGYIGGFRYSQGGATGGDFWFREGLYVVPEPGATAFGALAVLMLAARRAVRRWQL